MLARLRLSAPRRGVLAAVSGGGDSVALALLLRRACGEKAIPLALGHVDHGLRPDSGQDAEFVERLAGELGLGFFLRRVAVAGKGASPEEAARSARRKALLELARKAGAGVVALGHTLDDQAETVLHRALVGTGPTGLAGMRALSGPWWRPLLGVTRRELRDYLKARGQTWRTDPSNLELDYARNRVRHKILPMAKEFINPKAPQALARLAEVSAQEEDYWLKEALAFLNAHARVEGSSLCLAAGPLAALHPAAQRRMLRYALEGYLGTGQHLGLLHLERLRDLLLGAPGRQADLAGGLWAGREADLLRLDNCPAALPELFLDGPACLDLPGLGRRLVVEWASEPGALAGRGPEAWLPESVVRWPLEIRAPKPGDRFHPLGAPGGKKLARFFQDAKTPPWWRARSMVVLSAGEIIWVGPWAPDEKIRRKGGENGWLRLALVDTQPVCKYTHKQGIMSLYTH